MQALWAQDSFDIGIKGISGNNLRSVKFNFNSWLFIKITWNDELALIVVQLKIKNK